MTTLNALPDYPAPFFLQLTGYEQVQASGLEMTRSPGKYMVYLGCGLLIAGVFMLFYLRQRRLWVYLKDAPGASAEEAARTLVWMATSPEGKV